MSLVSNWGVNKESIDLINETNSGNLRELDEEKIKTLLFFSIRSYEINAIKNILNFNRSLINEKLYGYEGCNSYMKYYQNSLINIVNYLRQ